MRLPFQVTKNITLLGSELFNLYLVKGESYAIVEGGVSGITYPFSKGFLELFPPEENLRLWKLLIQRTLEHFGIEMEEKR
jgi:hypothetical protein